MNLPEMEIRPKVTSPRLVLSWRTRMMRRLIFTALLCVSFGASTGCFIPIYSTDPVRRTEQLIFTSEDLRAMLDQWERIWFLDQPDHMSPQRVHGGVI
jgi:hypothetical protein